MVKAAACLGELCALDMPNPPAALGDGGKGGNGGPMCMLPLLRVGPRRLMVLEGDCR